MSTVTLNPDTAASVRSKLLRLFEGNESSLKGVSQRAHLPHAVQIGAYQAPKNTLVFMKSSGEIDLQFPGKKGRVSVVARLDGSVVVKGKDK